jgi:osmoprotectant transport system permease protein
MGLLADLAAWFTDPANWRGDDSIANRLTEHVAISASAMLIALVIALPVALYIGHTGRGAFLAVSVSNIGRAVPSFAVLVIAFPFSIVAVRGTDIPFWLLATLVAMVALAIPPVVTNTYAGLRAVDRDLVEAARGMGMTGGAILRDVEVPLALPVMLAGMRTAAVQVVATATLAAVIGGGGLGRYLIQGIARFDTPRLVAGALMVALLAIATELAFAWLQRRGASATPGARPPDATITDATQPPGVTAS